MQDVVSCPCLFDFLQMALLLFLCKMMNSKWNSCLYRMVYLFPFFHFQIYLYKILSADAKPNCQHIYLY